GDYLSPDFVRELYHAAKGINPEAYIVGEVWGIAASWFKHGALDGVMNYRLRDGIVAFFARDEWSAERFAQHLYGLRRSYPPEANYHMYNLAGSHDVPRFLTLCGGDRRRLILAYAFLFTYIGAPAIYYGDEVGLEGGEDPDCRRPFPWEEEQWDRDLLETVRKLARIRQASWALRRGDFRMVEARGRLLSFLRRWEGEEAFVVLNAGDRKGQAKLPSPGPWQDLGTGEQVREDHVPVETLGFRILRRAVGGA
ncbi:hypothetical protein H5T52_00790, partial [Candidatus Bipolaricaulota bacterium]|nr:hypothetical protein [Candidatus Bipolaricaulota bacterium]